MFGWSFFVKRWPLRVIRPVPGKFWDSRLKHFASEIRQEPGTFAPYRLEVEIRVASNKPTVAVVDPHSDWGEPPRTGDDEVRLPVAVYVAGNDTQSTALSEDAE
jgi:hypothetical protein